MHFLLKLPQFLYFTMGVIKKHSNIFLSFKNKENGLLNNFASLLRFSWIFFSLMIYEKFMKIR